MNRDFVASPGELPAGPSRVPVPSLALIVLDGWGLAPPGPGNAIAQAATPVYDGLWEGCPHTTLSASGLKRSEPIRSTGKLQIAGLQDCRKGEK